MEDIENVQPKNAIEKKSKKLSKKALKDVDENVDEDSPTIEQIYQKKTQLEHILLRPDTYVGSIEKITTPMFVYDDEEDLIKQKEVTYVPGLYKIFDEILVNASDNKQRDSTMDTIKVTIHPEEGSISVWNNGNGIPIVKHKEHEMYIPEMIFGHLLTGSNFNDKKKKTTGGRNGYGAKLANIFSTQFVIETASSAEKLHYKQNFSHNMTEKEDPVIKSWNKKDFTCVTFVPDLNRFGMASLDKDIVSLMKKRVFDIAGTTIGGLSVYFNGEKLTKAKTFAKYVELYQPLPKPDEDGIIEKKVYFEVPDERWQVGVQLSLDGFQQVSFVNSICTTKGGQHVNYITDQIVSKLTAVLKKKSKGEVLKPAYIKNHLSVYVAALIENPAFDSQTKETLTTRATQFGSKHVLSEKFLKQVEKCGVVEKILDYAKFKQSAELKRKGGTKQKKLTGITKLDDANFAGTAKSVDCTLILTEGDSAKALAMSGLGVIGRDFYGVFPLKGKLLNVREAAHKQIVKNEEIQNIVKILGLKFGTNYENAKSLRYGHVMIMADQDNDGSHIKGLVINFIHHYWPSLFALDGFLQEFITPIVKARKGNSKNAECISFYTLPQYETWKNDLNDADSKKYNIKYYKGLGTSSAQEAKEYFSDLRTHRIKFSYQDEHDSDVIDMAFSKKRVADRKQWLNEFVSGQYVDYDVDKMQYTDFVNKELVMFSMADNARSIPSLIDGLKPSQRKILYSCFKRNLKNEIKVAQLAGYVSEHSAYHHGEASLTSTIVNMAQDFVGSNNIHLLTPSGQFGTRLLGGKDAASPRYVFTKLEAISRLLFNPNDDGVLEYLVDDGQTIEPTYYVPIIPMILVNGADGIGTGWSTSIPNFNPMEIIVCLLQMLEQNDENAPQCAELQPWYRGFEGVISAKDTIGTQFQVSGKYFVRNETTMVITELPVKTWTSTYKQFLETLIESGTIKDFSENHTDISVWFTIEFHKEMTEAEMDIFAKKLKLTSNLSTSNMHLFGTDGTMQKFSSALSIIKAYYPIRLQKYNERKEFMLKQLFHEKLILENKMRFIIAVVENEFIISNRKKKDILMDLQEAGYDPIQQKTSARVDPEEIGDDHETSVTDNHGYDYLLSLKLWNLTKERVDQIRASLERKKEEYQELLSQTAIDLWRHDLEELKDALVVAEKREEEERQNLMTNAMKGSSKTGKKTSKKSGSKEINIKMSEKAASKAIPVVMVKKSVPRKVPDTEVLSLAERMELKMQVTPKKAVKSKKTGAAKAKVEPDVKTPIPKEKLKKRAGNAAKKLLESSATTAASLKRRKEKTPKKKIQSNIPIDVSSPWKVSPDKKKQRAISVVSDDDSDLSDNSAAAIVPVNAAARPKRNARQASKAVIIDDSLDDSFESDFEEASSEEDESDFSDD